MARGRHHSKPAADRAPARAHTPDPVHLCFCAYVTRLTVFVSLRVIVCHRLCERLSVSAAGEPARACACRHTCTRTYGREEGEGGRAAGRGGRDMI